MQEPKTPAQQPFSVFFVDGIIVGDWTGAPTLEAVRASFAETLAQPEFKPGMPTLAQFRAEIEPPDADQLKLMAAEMAVHRGKLGPTALVVNSNQQLARARDLTAFCSMSGVQVGVFTQVQDAVRWLRREMEHKQAG